MISSYLSHDFVLKQQKKASMSVSGQSQHLDAEHKSLIFISCICCPYNGTDLKVEVRRVHQISFGVMSVFF